MPREPPRPQGAAYDPGTEMIYLADGDDGSVHRFEGAYLAPLDPIRLGAAAECTAAGGRWKASSHIAPRLSDRGRDASALTRAVLAINCNRSPTPLVKYRLRSQSPRGRAPRAGDPARPRCRRHAQPRPQRQIHKNPIAFHASPELLWCESAAPGGGSRAARRSMVLQQTWSWRLPTGPSIAVLPLTNLTGDRAQEYFVDGVTKDISTESSPLSVVSAAIQARTSRTRISRYPKSRYGAS